MNHFIYTDNKAKQVVFECDAQTITEADVLFTEHTNIDPIKAFWIGCQVKKN